MFHFFFTFMLPCIVTNFFIIKPTICTNSTNLFWYETLNVSDSSSVHHQEFILCTLSNGICHTGLQTAFEKDQDGTVVPSWSCSCEIGVSSWFYCKEIMLSVTKPKPNLPTFTSSSIFRIKNCFYQDISKINSRTVRVEDSEEINSSDFYEKAGRQEKPTANNSW